MIPPPQHPFQLGHESAGAVLEAPAGSGLAAGDRVAVYNLVRCGQCVSCRSGRDSICIATPGQLGFSLPGTFADIVRIPAENLVPLPDNVSFETAALLSCSGMTAVHACRLAHVGLGDVVIVNGIGGVGTMVVQVAVAAGARVLAVADSAARGDLAVSLGASDAIVLEGGHGYDTLPERVAELTGGAGATHFVELVGTKETYLAGIRALGPAGTVVLIGYTDDHLDVHPIELILKELTIVSSVAAARRDLVTAVDLAAAGRIGVTIDTRYPLAEVNTALARLKAREVRGRNVLVW
jgi:D-arabinose 1-dehydrogenase-like Zn-dependent alcohol dehydrogenase